VSAAACACDALAEQERGRKGIPHPHAAGSLAGQQRSAPAEPPVAREFQPVWARPAGRGPGAPGQAPRILEGHPGAPGRGRR